jgi:hypothetical protein
MRRNNITYGRIIINHEAGPCGDCRDYLPRILRPGQTLEVYHSPDRGQTVYVDTFRGGNRFNPETDRELLEPF